MTLNWIDQNTFEIGASRITLDYAPGGSLRASRANDFTMIKTKEFLNHYLMLAGGGYDRVLEVGVYQGGSFVFLDEILKPKKFSAIELSVAPVPALDAYVANAGGRCRLHYGTSQDDVEAVKRIVEADFGGQLDLVVDDASHFYEPTRATFQAVFPKIRPGGLCIIEDWSWSFESEFQGDDAPWRDQNALANLVIDLMEDMMMSPLIEAVEIHRPLLKVWRSSAVVGPIPFAKTARRGRPSSLI